MRLLCIALLALPGAASAVELPDPVYFRVQMELGDIGKAREWLDAGLHPDTLGDGIGSGLIIGAREGNLPLMELFLARGADINKANQIGETAIMHAAWKGNAAAIRWLIDHGAKINQGDLQWSALHYAVFSGHAGIARALVDQGADINARSSNGSSVLMMAIYAGREDLAYWLIDKGADPSPRNDWGDGALEWSMKFGHTNIARRITDARNFARVASIPKAQWGEVARSLPAAEPDPPPADSEELQRLQQLRELIAERKLDVGKIDGKIAAERVRLHRASVATRALPPAATRTLEISARRAMPEDQKARIVGTEP